ncbi:helix-turn-helix domain-containing protein [Lentibacillus cibarius]|uniref:Helix-turn-helix domain-containing protein n=1 Tax=Lentibacillus cibarius TaxID=2583219 RepID=A0A549YID9_9BACI|nr:helix-turn-helix domain-containing protein [Lentibacillus cibarius]TMN22845.1 helix-turn-helix domain-containing protein [Lentibacillus cibarius]TRM11634.1 helix-turn-helix domain-containing protein [Lentibacillus cibarius]
MSLEKIGYNIKFLREQNEWTQQYLADQLHISRYVVIRWEANKVIPDLENLVKLSELFDVTIDHLVGNRSHREDLLKDFKRIYGSKTKSFDDEAVELVQYVMENPSLKEQLFRMRSLPIRKQHAVLELLRSSIDQFEPM